MSIVFSEAVNTVGRGLSVVGPSGLRLDRGKPRQVGTSLVLEVADGGRGSYIVSFSVVSKDTHPLSGRYTFSVGPPSGGVNLSQGPTGDLGATTPAGLVLQTLARWLHFAGYALGFGSLVFGLVVLGDPGGGGRLLRLAGAGALLMVLAEPLALIGQAAGLGDFPFLDQQALAAVLGSTFGLLLALRAGGALMLWSLLGAMRQPGAGTVAHLAIALGAAVAAVDAGSAHALRSPLPDLLSVPVSALHEMAMAVWVGGLAGLLVSWPRFHERIRLGRFARLAGVGVALLAVSGGLLALGHLRSPADLVATAYGRSLGLKSLAFAAALGLAYVGRRGGGLTRVWRVEAAAMAVILALAGLLVTLPPPR